MQQSQPQHQIVTNTSPLAVKLKTSKQHQLYKPLTEQEQQQQFRELIEMMDKNQDYDNRNREKRLLKNSDIHNNNSKIESHTNTMKVNKFNSSNTNHILLPQSVPTFSAATAEIISKKSLFDVGVIEKQLDGSNERETIMNNSHR